MNRYQWIFGRGLWLAVLTASSAWLSSGCNRIADKDRIEIAKYDDRVITRGDLATMLREMDDSDRPKIRTKTDLRRVLNQYMDRQIKVPLGIQLASEGKIAVNRDQAREAYFKERGDDESMYRQMWAMDVDNTSEATPLMKEYNMTPQRIRSFKSLIEDGTDDMVKRMQGDQAVSYLAVEAYKQGGMKVDEDALQTEYDLRKDEFHQLERIHFLGIRVPASTPNALTVAGRVREEIDRGANFELLTADLRARSADAVIESDIENNPTLDRFKGFWESASGAKAGDILGPVYLPEFQSYARDAQGQVKATVMPEAWVILKVLERFPEHEVSFEEAKPLLIPEILEGQMVGKLRQDHGVQIFEDRLPDPSMSGGGTGDPFLDKR